MMEFKVEPKVVHATGVVERSFPYPPETVFAALRDPARLRRWYGEGAGTELLEFTAEFKEGGWNRIKYKMMPGTPIAGMILSNDVMYQQIIPDERVVTASTMKLNDKSISASQVTFELIRTATGTDLICTHQDALFENSGGPEMRAAGWRTLMDKLVAVVRQDNE